MKRSIFLFGALTSKPYAFKARSWELRSIETIDLFDSLGSNIRVDIRGSEIMRILPVVNECINGEWISDKARYAYDGLTRDRYINPMVKQKGYFVQSTWKNVFMIIRSLHSKNYKNFIINTGNFVDLETFSALDILSKTLHSKYNLSINTHLSRNLDFQENYTINSKMLSFNGKKVFLLVGVNLRLENPILNIRFKKLSNASNVLIGYIGARHDHNINFIHLGNNFKVLTNILIGKHNFCTICSSFLKTNNKDIKISSKYKNKISIIFGNDFIQSNIDVILELKKIIQINNDLFEYGFLENYIGKINAFEVGFFNNIRIPKNQKKIFYLVNTEELINKNKDDFVIFQGHHNIRNRIDFDVILPSLVWTEKSAIFINLFGFIQKTQFVIIPPINCRNDWKIVLMLMMSLCEQNIIPSNWNSKEVLHYIHSHLNKLSPNVMSSIGKVRNNIKKRLTIDCNKVELAFSEKHQMPFKTHIHDYYRITSTEKASKIMNVCSFEFNKNKSNFLK